jgi:phospholipid/cholesterol/gamma-HCH transport system ATP-binding protein
LLVIGWALDPQLMTPSKCGLPAVSFEHVALAFDDDVVLRDVSFSVPSGKMTILIGASGSGKSVLLKLILGLLRPDAGIIRVNGMRIDKLSESGLVKVRDEIGMLFQESALFDSLTVAENVGYKLYEETDMPWADVRRRIEEVLGFIGLAEYIDRMPSELSGGQRRRVAIARAIAARPHLLLFDEPTSGLDPITAKTVDAEILKLRDLEQVTSILVTHQLQDAFYVATHRAVRRDNGFAIEPAPQLASENAEFLMLKDGGIYFQGRARQLLESTDSYVVRFMSDWVPPLVA